MYSQFTYLMDISWNELATRVILYFSKSCKNVIFVAVGRLKKSQIFSQLFATSDNK